MRYGKFPNFYRFFLIRDGRKHFSSRSKRTLTTMSDIYFYRGLEVLSKFFSSTSYTHVSIFCQHATLSIFVLFALIGTESYLSLPSHCMMSALLIFFLFYFFSRCLLLIELCIPHSTRVKSAATHFFFSSISFKVNSAVHTLLAVSKTCWPSRSGCESFQTTIQKHSPR